MNMDFDVEMYFFLVVSDNHKIDGSEVSISRNDESQFMFNRCLPWCK